MRADPITLAIEHVAWCMRQDLTPHDRVTIYLPFKKGALPAGREVFT